MKLISFEAEGRARLGVVDAGGGEVADLGAADARLPGELGALLADSGMAALKNLAAKAKSAPRRKLAGLRYGLPVARPSKIVCLGLNYVDHAAEGGHARPEYPSFFMRGPSSLVAHGQPILRPRVSDKLDYEAELAVVIGRRGRHVAKADALDLVAGYSCFNDGSVRDYQRKTTQWTIGKNFDATGGFGPWLVTPEDLPPGAKGLSIESRLNGQAMQKAVTDDMLFPVDETIALLTECMTLEPGDLIAMGTPAGVGYARKPPVFMKAGDTVEIVIGSIGTLSNPIRDEQ